MKKQKQKKLNIFIGWDSREDIAYEICKDSIISTTQNQTNITPIKQQEMRKAGIYKREIDVLASTEFTFTRFLVPHLCNFQGWALFCDCDFLFLHDIENIFDLADDRYAVMVVKHDYKPKNRTKMDGQTQLPYPRKNWSSLILWNCGHHKNKILTANKINEPNVDGAYLHRFQWLNDVEIGNISQEWNWLVNWYKEPKDGHPKALHFTEGGPWFKEYENCDYANKWFSAKSYYYEKKYTETHTSLIELNNKRKQDQYKNTLDNLNVTKIILDNSKKQNLINYFNFLKDPYKIFYNTYSIELEKKVAAIYPPGFDPQRKNLEFDEYLESLVQGIPNAFLSNWHTEKDTDNILLVRGLTGVSQDAIKSCWKNKRNFYSIDTGYLGNGSSKGKLYHRITKNQLQNLGPIIERDTDRLQALDYGYKKFKSGSTILICPSSDNAMQFWNQAPAESWSQNIKKQLRRYTDRPIEIRLKPSRTQRLQDDNFIDLLKKDIYCVITFNSIAAAEALFNGIPAITLGSNSAACICDTKLSAIENLKTYERDLILAFAAHLSYCQFNKIEMQDGTAWRILNESH